MAVDPSIALSVKPVEMRDPLQSYAQAQMLRHSMQQNEMLGLQQQQLRTTIAENEGVRGVFGDQSNYEPHPITQQPVLKADARRRLLATSPKAYEDYAARETQGIKTWGEINKEQAEVADRKQRENERLHAIAVKIATAARQGYVDALKEGKAEQEAWQTGEQARVAVRQSYVDNGALKADTPQEPFDPVRTKAFLDSTMSYKDSRQADTEHQTKGWQVHTDEKGQQFWTNPTVKNGAPHYIIDPATQQPVRSEDAVGPVIPIKGPSGGDDQVAGVTKRGNLITFDVTKTAGRNISAAEERATAQYNEMRQGHQVLSEMAAGKPAAEGQKPVPGIARAPWEAWMYNIHDDESFFNHLKGAVANGLMSPEQQQFLQAARQFVVAGGHQMNGARITDSQFKLLWQTYIGQPNESDAVVAQKARARDNFVESAKVMAGRGAEALEAQRRKDQTEIDRIAQTKAGAAKPPSVPRAPAAAGKAAEPNVYDPASGKFVPKAQVQAAPAATPAATPTAAQPAEADYTVDDFPKDSLKPGFATPFTLPDGSTQRWTLENGKPKRLDQ